jgi:hypothetical protein
MTWSPYKLQIICRFPPDLPLITPDILKVKLCTRQQELYYRICMDVQDVDAQPLRYGRRQYRGAAPAHRLGGKLCYAYLKPGEVLQVRRGTSKTQTRARQLNATLRQMWLGFRV